MSYIVKSEAEAAHFRAADRLLNALIVAFWQF